MMAPQISYQTFRKTASCASEDCSQSCQKTFTAFWRRIRGWGPKWPEPDCPAQTSRKHVKRAHLVLSCVTWPLPQPQDLDDRRLVSARPCRRLGHQVPECAGTVPTGCSACQRPWPGRPAPYPESNSSIPYPRAVWAIGRGYPATCLAACSSNSRAYLCAFPGRALPVLSRSLVLVPLRAAPDQHERRLPQDQTGPAALPLSFQPKNTVSSAIQPRPGPNTF